jgi:parallel beta-helix repeat protein
MKKILCSVIFLAVAGILFSNVARAATIVVTNTGDAGAGSLRQAITDANVNPVDADNITFNIPVSDPNYNAGTGVYTITLLSILPYVQSLSVSIDGTTQPGNTNPNGPEICLKSNTNILIGLCFPLSGGKAKGLIINGFQIGILITKVDPYPSGSCLVSDCYLGVNYNGTLASANDIGVACYAGVASDTIKNNLISGNITAGVGIRRSNSNVIKNNKIGTDRTGMFRIPNYYGVAIDSSASNLVGGNSLIDCNIISGNSYAGVAINTNMSHDNIVKGNHIGININGIVRTDTICNFYGIAINDSYNNIIGGMAASDPNVISGNSEGGIAILGASAKNTLIQGNRIGTNLGGTDSIPNGNGILLSGASNTIIGGNNAGARNVISGNKLAGIAMAYSGTRNNSVKGNYIGVDLSGTQILSNYTGIYIKSNANSNIIGGSTAGERNIISGNIEMGLCIESADSNVIIGNYIGPDKTGIVALKLGTDSLVQANGLYFNSNAKYNIAGGYNAGDRNVISGNRIYGHDLYGNSSYNSTIGNYIGVDATGNVAMPNATGICVDGGSNHNPFINNVLSGNVAYGIFIVTTGTGYNELKGNIIGLNAAGTDTVPNQSGLLLGGGTKNNVIGGTTATDRNIISGNRFDGILVADTTTMNNVIKGNYIGTDITGSIAKPNYIGVGFATKPSHNNVENNVISGNDYIGLIIYERCDSNLVFSNKIGVAADGTSDLGNGGAGVVIAKASRLNSIGAVGKGNIIAYNDSVGIGIVDTNTINNFISANTIFSNGIMGIDIFPYGVNPNDAGDIDLGSNERMNYPVIQNVFLDWFTGKTTVTGTMDYTINGGPVGVYLQFFKSDGANMFGHGDAIEYVGDTIIVNGSGNWSYTTAGFAAGDVVTATATDMNGNTSEFAQNVSLTVGINENSQNNDFAIYPNPATDKLNVTFNSDGTSEIKIVLYSITGQIISILENGVFSAGNHTVYYDLNQNDIKPGMYFIGFFDSDKLIKTNKLVISQ